MQKCCCSPSKVLNNVGAAVFFGFSTKSISSFCFSFTTYVFSHYSQILMNVHAVSLPAYWSHLLWMWWLHFPSNKGLYVTKCNMECCSSIVTCIPKVPHKWCEMLYTRWYIMFCFFLLGVFYLLGRAAGRLFALNLMLLLLRAGLAGQGCWCPSPSDRP